MRDGKTRTDYLSTLCDSFEVSDFKSKKGMAIVMKELFENKFSEYDDYWDIDESQKNKCVIRLKICTDSIACAPVFVDFYFAEDHMVVTMGYLDIECYLPFHTISEEKIEYGDALLEWGAFLERLKKILESAVKKANFTMKELDSKTGSLPIKEAT